LCRYPALSGMNPKLAYKNSEAFVTGLISTKNKVLFSQNCP